MFQALGYADLRTFRNSIRGLVRGMTYSIPATLVPGNTSVPATTNVESSSTFFLTTISGVVLLSASNAVADPTVTAYPDIDLVDTTSGASLLDRSNVRAGEIFGSAKWPMFVDPAHPFEPGSVISVIINNNSATSLRVQVVLSGYKRYGR